MAVMSRSQKRGRTVPVDERFRVVLAVSQGEMSVAEAARRHGVTATTISNWRDRFIEAGKGGLENKISGACAWWDRRRAASAVGERAAQARSPSRWSSCGCGRRGPSTLRMSLL
jgi:transposase-like protein